MYSYGKKQLFYATSFNCLRECIFFHLHVYFYFIYFMLHLFNFCFALCVRLYFLVTSTIWVIIYVNREHRTMSLNVSSRTFVSLRGHLYHNNTSLGATRFRQLALHGFNSTIFPDFSHIWLFYIQCQNQAFK